MGSGDGAGIVVVLLRVLFKRTLFLLELFLEQVTYCLDYDESGSQSVSPAPN